MGESNHIRRQQSGLFHGLKVGDFQGGPQGGQNEDVSGNTQSLWCACVSPGLGVFLMCFQ